MSYPRISEQLDDPDAAREAGREKMDWALQHMPILSSLREEFEAEAGTIFTESCDRAVAGPWTESETPTPGSLRGAVTRFLFG